MMVTLSSVTFATSTSAGADGFPEIEKMGNRVFTNEQLNEEIKRYPKVAQFNRAVLTVLRNYAAGIARGMVEYGVENGLDMWRKVCHRYVPPAEDLQHMLISE